jgi:glycosyltransferase involved in cell wall biosynthesis
MSDRPAKLSVIVAAYNEQASLDELYSRISGLDWAQLGAQPEILFVDDHSTDATPAVLERLATQDPRVKVLRFSRNFGSHKAFTAGLENCSGEAAVILAGDLQDPPETIPDLVAKWRQGARVVWAVRAAREGISAGSRFLSAIYWRLMRRFADVQSPKEGADFLLVDRCVIDVLKGSPEKHTSLLALIQWMGFAQDQVAYVKAARRHGSSKWTFRKKLKLALDSFVGFSYFPIRLMSGCGIVFALTGFVYALVVAARAIALGSPVEGWASLMCVVLIVSGVQLMMLGVLGEYLWRAFDEIRGRPRYIIEKRINC